MGRTVRFAGARHRIAFQRAAGHFLSTCIALALTPDLIEVLGPAAKIDARECQLLAPICISPIDARAPTLMQRLSVEAVPLLTGTCKTFIQRIALGLLLGEIRIPHVGAVTASDALTILLCRLHSTQSLTQLRCVLGRSETTISATARTTAIWLVRRWRRVLSWPKAMIIRCQKAYCRDLDLSPHRGAAMI